MPKVDMKDEENQDGWVRKGEVAKTEQGSIQVEVKELSNIRAILELILDELRYMNLGN